MLGRQARSTIHEQLDEVTAYSQTKIDTVGDGIGAKETFEACCE